MAAFMVVENEFQFQTHYLLVIVFDDFDFYLHSYLRIDMSWLHQILFINAKKKSQARNASKAKPAQCRHS